MDKLTLSIAFSDNERTRPIAQGRHHPQGVNLIPTVVHPSEMFWRQLKYRDFDVSEMSLSSLIMATARGDNSWVALPIYTSRKFKPLARRLIETFGDFNRVLTAPATRLEQVDGVGPAVVTELRAGLDALAARLGRGKPGPEARPAHTLPE